MTRSDDAPPGAAMTSVLRRAILSADRADAAIQDRIDCAQLLQAAGHPAAARTLYDLVMLCDGTSPAALRRRSAIRDAAGLWPEAAQAAGDAMPLAFSIDLAVDELRRLLARELDLPPLPASIDPDAIVAPPGDPGEADIAATCTDLLQLLDAPFDADALGAALDRAEALVAGAAGIDDVDGDIDALAGRLARSILRRFLAATRDVWAPPLGSPALFHAAARLQDGGLGPWFRNVGLLIRDTGDLFGLVQLAATDPADDRHVPDRDRTERWVILLATGLDVHQRLDLVDRVGDLGLLRAVSVMLTTLVRQPHAELERETLWRIRDAGIDNADYRLAVAAQRVIVTRVPGVAIERMVLGEILASGGDMEDAERVLTGALAIDPDRTAVLARLAAIRAGDFTKYRVRHGFGSSPDRRFRRAARLAARNAAIEPGGVAPSDT